MPDTRGHIELDRALDSITVGVRHRKDPGDIATLMESIDRLGLLQPVTITPEGVLVCGWRRLEAVRRLGWHSMKVWVRSGISDKLESLLAQQDENQLHKPLNELEKAALYRELKALRAEEAERRMQATQFGAQATGGSTGSAPGAQPGEPGDARSQAAMAITGKASYNTHERVCALMDWASRKATPPEIRTMANEALRKIEQGERVKPALPQGQGCVREDAGAAARCRDRPRSTGARSARTCRARGTREGPQEPQTQPGLDQPLPQRPLLQSDLDGARRLDRAVRRRSTRRPTESQRLGAVRPRCHRHDRVPRPAHRGSPPRVDAGVASAPIRRP